MATAQINVRLSQELKAAGDAALMEAGISPSQIVRALWEKVSQRGQSLEDVVELLLSAPQGDEDAARARKLATIDRMSQGFEAFAQANGLEVAPDSSTLDWHEAVWQERTKKWQGDDAMQGDNPAQGGDAV